VSCEAAIRAQLEGVFRASLAAVEPAAAVRRHVASDAAGRLCIAGQALDPEARLAVLAVGKAAAPMARALEAAAGERIAAGLAIVPSGHALALERFEVCEASHPLPDARSERAARRVQHFVAATSPRDVLVVLLSGGTSSLLSCPAPGLDLEDFARTTSLLLAGAAAIDELNAVRKHLSAVAGGRLALAATAERVEVLTISDVPGDRVDTIGSGPFAGDPTTYADALAALDARDLRARLPGRIRAHLEAGARGEREETPGVDDPRLQRVRHTLVASNAMALEAACACACELGWRAVVVTDGLCGEARVAGRRLAALCDAVRAAVPTLLLAGGETVVNVRGAGRGGRNQELALAAALALEGRKNGALLAAGTDGTDGPTDAAGAFADGGTVKRGAAHGLDARAALADNDAYGFFSTEGGLLRTGPTRTNVMDLAFAYVAPR
jgi:glycerate-2-kinase